MQTIPTPTPITTRPRPLNSQLWTLIAKERAGTATASERADLDLLCAQLEAAAEPKRRLP